MADYCDDCGCRVYNGTCSNCYEALYIVENQSGYLPENPSPEFIEEVERQRAARPKEPDHD